MMELTDERFDSLITKAMDELPQEYIRGLKNVAIVMADEPDDHQKQKLKLRHDHLLLGLYEGVPRTMRGGNEFGVLPDKITLFKYPILAVSYDEDGLFEQIKRTLWHEIAHYYGLDHDRIDLLEQRSHSHGEPA
jgi:predicted Zn-dependent protease with MMP-like domain